MMLNCSSVICMMRKPFKLDVDAKKRANSVSQNEGQCRDTKRNGAHLPEVLAKRNISCDGGVEVERRQNEYDECEHDAHGKQVHLVIENEIGQQENHDSDEICTTRHQARFGRIALAIAALGEIFARRHRKRGPQHR